MELTDTPAPILPIGPNHVLRSRDQTFAVGDTVALRFRKGPPVPMPNSPRMTVTDVIGDVIEIRGPNGELKRIAACSLVVV